MSLLKVFQNGELLKELSLTPEEEYIFGRGNDCDFVMDNQTGVSRQHFKIYFDGTQWVAEVLSRFGGLVALGAEVEILPLEAEASFKVYSYEFTFKSENVKESISIENQMVPSVGRGNSPAPVSADKTMVDNQKATPYLRIVTGNGEESNLRLEGNLWTAGRDVGCEIIIKDRGASRRHFELSVVGNQAFVVDLNSANGTLVNGNKIPPDQSTPIKSGDILSVLSVQMTFEMRDPNFEKNLGLVPAPILEPVNIQPDAAMMAAGGVLPSQVPDLNDQNSDDKESKALTPSIKNLKQWQNWEFEVKGKKVQMRKHKKKVYIGAALAFVILFFALPTPTPQTQKSRVPANVHEAFANLSPEKKTFIQDTYKLAKNLYLKRNYPLALKELNEIHELIPFYEDSKKMAAECKQFIEIREQQEYIARQRQAAKELERRINAKVQECENRMTPQITMQQLNRCLGRAMDLNPDHPGIRRLQAIIEEREADARRRAQEKAEFEKKAKKAKALYMKAKKLHDRGKDYYAIGAYKRFLRTKLPDAYGLKPKAKRSLASLQSNLDFKVDSQIKRAQSYFDQSNYREAMEVLKAIDRINPRSSKTKETRQKFMKQISRQMKTIYQDSVLEESLGNIEAAKDKWRKIKALSYPGDSYYKKAIAKLKKHGG